eukprot:Gb_35542 [translate_table: standard]
MSYSFRRFLCKQICVPASIIVGAYYASSFGLVEGMDLSNGRCSMAWALAMVSALAMVHLVSTTDHIVGGNRGWNPGVNFTEWVKSQTFVVGDWIWFGGVVVVLFAAFRYQRDQHNVVQVNQSGYDNCTMDNAIGNWSSGKDFFFLNESKRYYYVDGRGFCYNGMKITFFVNETAPAPNPSAENDTTKKSSSDSGARCALRPTGLIISALFLVVGALFFY